MVNKNISNFKKLISKENNDIVAHNNWKIKNRIALRSLRKIQLETINVLVKNKKNEKNN